MAKILKPRPNTDLNKLDLIYLFQVNGTRSDHKARPWFVNCDNVQIFFFFFFHDNHYWYYQLAENMSA